MGMAPTEADTRCDLPSVSGAGAHTRSRIHMGSYTGETPGPDVPFPPGVLAPQNLTLISFGEGLSSDELHYLARVLKRSLAVSR
jgi:hypothetical protein